MLDEFLHLRDILEACEDIEEFVTGVSMEQFLESKLIRWAVIQRLSVIGEGGAHLSEDLKKSTPKSSGERSSARGTSWYTHILRSTGRSSGIRCRMIFLF